jgi:hypothetical protein
MAVDADQIRFEVDTPLQATSRPEQAAHFRVDLVLGLFRELNTRH